MLNIDRAVYPTQAAPLRAQIDQLLKAAPTHEIDGEVIAVVVPDSNRLDVGSVAAEVYKTVAGRRYDSVILVSPSHMGRFPRITICRLDEYYTPLGGLKVDDRLRNELCDEDDDIYMDDSGHFHTEGIDVQLPFLQTVLEGPFDIVPIVMGEERPSFCRELGTAVGEVMYNRRTLVVACSDVLAGGEAELEQFTKLFEANDVSRLMAYLNSETLTVEGKGPLIVSLIAGLHRRATGAKVLSVRAPEDGLTGAIGAVIWR